MKYLRLIFLFCTTAVLAQPPSLIRDTKKLYEAFDTIDIDGLAKMMCHSGTEEEFTSGLDKWFQNEEFKFRYVFTNAKYQFVEIPTDAAYSVTFRNVIRITYFKPTNVADKKEELRKMFAAQAIVYDPARNCFLITYQAKMIARNMDGTNWKFTFADNTIPAELSKGCITKN